MSGIDFYGVTIPSVWAEEPEQFSFSSLGTMGACLRKWQLLHSKFPMFARDPERPSEAAAVGTIVHDLLSRLLGAMAQAGYPAIDSEAFGEAIADVGILPIARTALLAFEAKTVGNPRVRGFVLKSTPRDVYNKVSPLFRGQYLRMVAPAQVSSPRNERVTDEPGAGAGDRLRALERRGFLSEATIQHPSLPIMGIIDLLERRDGKTTLIDFKTGAVHAEYRAQLVMYALLWWRATGDMPAAIEVRYATGVEAWEITEGELVSVEAALEADLARFRGGLKLRPAIANVGEHCAKCAVRQLCGDYWQRPSPSSDALASGAWTDAEVWVNSAASPTGFIGRDGQGRAVPVVFDEELGQTWAPFVVGEGLRLLGAAREAETAVLRITKGTEVFRTLGI